jgi:hypothetical protein
MIGVRLSSLMGLVAKGPGDKTGRQAAKVGGWTETRPISLGLLPSGPDPVGEWNVHRQPPAPYIGESDADYKRDAVELARPRAPP